MVERNLAKVEVASSSLVSRSKKPPIRPVRLAGGASSRLALVASALALALALAADAGCKTETEGEVATAAPVRLGGDRFRVDLFDDDHALGGAVGRDD